MRYTTEVEITVEVEVLDTERGVPWATPPTQDAVELLVRLGPLDVTPWLPADVLAGLEDDALERLRREADEP